VSHLGVAQPEPPPTAPATGSLAHPSLIGDTCRDPSTCNPEGGSDGWTEVRGDRVREVLRRLHLGEPDRRIARELDLSRNTVASYRRWAERRNLLSSPLPAAGTLAALLRPPERARPPHEQSTVAPFQEQVSAWPQQGVEGQAIFQLLVEQHGFAAATRP
jgi:hypothetical protein